MKIRMALALLILPVLSLAAYDFGLNLTDATAYSQTADQAFNQTNRADLWFETPIAGAKFRGEVTYDFAFVWTSAKTTLSPYRFDVGQFDLSGILGLADWGGAVEWDLGRFTMTDLSTWLVAGKADGVSATYYRGNLKLGTQAFYTGLLMKKSSRVSVTGQDKLDAADDKILLAPSRVVYSVNFGIQEFLLRQDVELEVLGTNDLRADSAKGLHAYYSTLRLSGPLVGLTRYKVGGTGQLMQESSGLSMAALAFLQTTTNLPWQSAKLVVDAQGSMKLGTGAQGFTPVSMKPVSLVVPTLGAGNLVAASVDFSLKPLPKLTVGAKDGVFVRATTLTNPLPNPNIKATGLYLGNEVQAYATWKATSELNLSLNGGVFLPNPDLMAPAVPLMYSVAFSANAAL